MHDIEAILKWTILEGEELVDKYLDVFVSEESVTRSEFYSSIQSGMQISRVFKMNIFEYQETKHLEKDTNKPLYATVIEVEGAVYDIKRTYSKKGSEDIEIICE